MPKSKNPKRVVVFIDYTNVFYRLKEENKVDPSWVREFDPEKLANKLAGNRKLVGVYFYCTRPPSDLLRKGQRGKEKYEQQLAYYDKIEKLKNVKVRYGSLRKSGGRFYEKNLDTKLTSDLVKEAALDRYDVAIIVSNDGDYVSGVEGIKEFRKGVESVYFKGRASMDLKKIADISRQARMVYFEELDQK